MKKKSEKILWKTKIKSRASFIIILSFIRLPMFKMPRMLEMVTKGGADFCASYIILGSF
jgi:hypothetical protein